VPATNAVSAFGLDEFWPQKVTKNTKKTKDGVGDFFLAHRLLTPKQPRQKNFPPFSCALCVFCGLPGFPQETVEYCRRLVDEGQRPRRVFLKDDRDHALTYAIGCEFSEMPTVNVKLYGVSCRTITQLVTHTAN
jgi:hypothetical protein